MITFKKLKVFAGLALFICIGIAAVKQPASSEFKNLQVLPKNITADSLDRIMDRFNADLGVDCKFCHVRDKKADTLMFDKDDKSEKEIARNMMRMTADINKKYFQFNETVTADQVQAVTCYTCHKANPMPEKEKPKAVKGAFEFKN
ncbi:MAG TPA: c-type cytochrome [Ferruginibacter sp.]|nr:c-type cytochrome [Ferruginibacter sp.]